MEAAEEPPNKITATEDVKANLVSCESEDKETVVQSDVSQKSNGVVNSNQSNQDQSPIEDSVGPDQLQPTDNNIELENNIVSNDIPPETLTAEIVENESIDIVIEDKSTENEEDKTQNNDESGDMQAGEVEVDGVVETTSDNVLFETEILIETNVDEPTSKYKIIYSDNDEPDPESNLLCEIGQNIELSEVLRSSDVTENIENNNSEMRQEVFNKEELLDILEGKDDVEESRKVVSENFQSECKKLETQLALQQLSRLKHTKRTRTSSKKFEKKSSRKIEPAKEESIVKALVKDWEDDEVEGDQSNKDLEESEKLQETDEMGIKQNVIIESNESQITDVSVSDEHTPNFNEKSSELQPQRRLGRVIKKKVIFDPDNPDTFTKSKVTIKKENPSENEVNIKKKIKVDPTSPKAKSPIQTKLQWKKPQPKNNKKYRLTEIDRLLMDEGAVNMICQLTPEAPKGHKNMKSKAEFIKKIQSSTPNSKEMKFRERKKDYKTEDGEPRKVGSLKERLSLSSSVKSPTVSEDFEAHSADDSIIYRRHSSSSYSSSCMSPRRLSDVETINQSAISASQSVVVDETLKHDGNTIVTDVFMSETEGTPQSGVINKKDLLSIKEKLNSKLSLALNKRKRENTKGEKPPKIKKVSKLSEKPVQEDDYTYLKLTNDKKLVEICIQNSGAIFNVQVMKELKTVLETLESNKDVSVILLTSESGSLCSGVDLKPVLDQENGSTYAKDLAESVRTLLCTLEAHSKFVCTAVGDRCQSIGLSLVALSDVAVASEAATFQLSSHKDGPLQPGVAVLSVSGLPQHLINELVVFERSVPAAEAVSGGLLSRTVWPHMYLEQVRTIAKHIAAQPDQNIMLKKQLLKLKRGPTGSLSSALEKESDLFVKYWTSVECVELVRASVGGA